MSAEFYAVCERILSGTANGVYQGVLVALLAGLVLRLFIGTNAATRHAVWFGVLLLVAALIPAHLFLSFLSRSEAHLANSPPHATAMDVPVAAPEAENTADSPGVNTVVAYSQLGESEAGPTADRPSLPPLEPQDELAAAQFGSEGDSEVRSEAAAAKRGWADLVPALIKPAPWTLEAPVRLPHSICLGLLFGWMLLATVRGALMAGRLGEVRRVKTTSTVPSERLQMLFDRLRDSLASGRNVRLRISDTHRTAVVLGFVHPVVLLPREMDKSAEDGEAEHVLRHELAHVERRDDWSNLAQQLIQAVLFFHPAVWWISAKLSLEREIACDDYVLEASGRPRAYALTLANVASRIGQHRFLLAPGVSNNNSQLQKRITMILNTQRDRSPRLARNRLGFLTTTTAAIAVLAVYAGPRLVLAQTPATSPPTADGVTTSSSITAVAPVTTAVSVALPPDAPDVESGPKPKPATVSSTYAAVIAAAPSAPAEPPEPAAAPPSADVSPVPPAPPSHKHGRRNMSVEDRLDRIERMLDDLEAQNDGKGPHHHVDVLQLDKGQVPVGIPVGLPGYVAVYPNVKLDLDLKRAAEEAKRAVEESQHSVEAGQRAAEAGQRAAEKAMRDIERLASKDFDATRDHWAEGKSDAPAIELQALRSARQSLERELENLTRQIKHLEDSQQRHNKSADGQPGQPDKDDDGDQRK